MDTADFPPTRVAVNEEPHRYVFDRTYIGSGDKLSLVTVNCVRHSGKYTHHTGADSQTLSSGHSVQLCVSHSVLLSQSMLTVTACSRDLLEKLIGSQPVKKFTTFYGTRRFITVFTSARHLSLS